MNNVKGEGLSNKINHQEGVFGIPRPYEKNSCENRTEHSSIFRRGKNNPSLGPWNKGLLAQATSRIGRSPPYPRGTW